jgi:hypothetical protein
MSIAHTYGPADRRRRRDQAGFVITLEVLLVIALFVLPVLVASLVLGRKLVTLYLNEREFTEQPYSRGVIWDSSDPVRALGTVHTYGAHDEPLIVFLDDATTAGVVLGVRRDRLTSAAGVYYSDDACTQNPRIRAWDAPAGTGTEPRAFEFAPAGFAYQLQERAYAMGSGNLLYASSEAGGTSVTPQPPCFAVPDGVTVENLVDATPVIDFDAPGNYTLPFRLAFPSPGTPSLSPSFNED